MQVQDSPQPENATPTDLIPLAEARLLIPSPRPGKRTNLATVYRIIDKGKLRAWRRGQWLFVSRADVLALIEVREVPERRETAAKTARWAEATLRRFGMA